MEIGMLWFDNDPKKPLAEKVSHAAGYYAKKYAKTPDLCLVHPSMLAGNEQESGNVVIRANRAILPGHLWIGVDEAAQ